MTVAVKTKTKLCFFLLTFYFHYLISVLNHFVFGLIAESMSPGLDQVQNLVPDIWFSLFLVAKEHQVKQRAFTYPVLYMFSVFISYGLSHDTSTTELTKLNKLCLMTIREVGSPLFSSCHQAMTPSGS